MRLSGAFSSSVGAPSNRPVNDTRPQRYSREPVSLRSINFKLILEISDCWFIRFFSSTSDIELPTLVAHLSLYFEGGIPGPLDVVYPGLRPAQSDLLYGTLVSSLQNLKNPQGDAGSYFIFPDVSVRRRGRYALRINLVPIHR